MDNIRRENYANQFGIYLQCVIASNKIGCKTDIKFNETELVWFEDMVPFLISEFVILCKGRPYIKVKEFNEMARKFIERKRSCVVVRGLWEDKFD